MIDPLEHLIGFYSVVGRRALLVEASQSLLFQGVFNSTNVRTSGVTSVI